MNWRALFVLGFAQSLLTLDVALGSISIRAVQEEFQTSIASVHSIAAFYALVAAALALTGGKLGDRWGRHRAFAIGMGLRTVGSLMSATAPNLLLFGVGEAVLEGIGMALVFPAIGSLAASIFSEKDRVKAFAVIGACSAFAAGLGPVVGGWVTTEWSWRYALGSEALFGLVVLLCSRWIPSVRPSGPKEPIDFAGVVLSAIGFALIVVGFQQAPKWGWFFNHSSPFSVFGLSLTPVVLLLGLGILTAFFVVESRRRMACASTVFDVTLLKSLHLNAVLGTSLGTQALSLGVLFIVPTYLQIVAGKSAFESGLAMLPLAVASFSMSLCIPRLQKWLDPRGLVLLGIGAMATGLGILFWDVSPSILGEPTYLAMAIFGLGSGVMSGKLGAITQSCVPENHRSSAAGLQCTALNFGAAMGVSILGSIMIAGLAIGMQGFISAEPTISNETREITGAIIARGIPMLTTAQAREAIVRNGIPSADHEKILALYAAAESRALEWAVAAAAALALLTAGVATLLPGRAKPSPTPGLFPVPNSKQGIS